MAAIHTPFLGGTGFGGRAEPGADSDLSPPYVPGQEGTATPGEEEEASGPTEIGFTAAAVTVPERETPDDQAVEDQTADRAEDLIEEEETEAGGLTPAAEVDSEAEDEAIGEDDQAESEFPDFLFGGDAGEERGPPASTSAGDAASSPSPASRLDPETRERIRALARELEGKDAAEDVIARAFEEGYRKAREEET